MKKLAKEASQNMQRKVAGFTQHGSEMEAARALALSDYSNDVQRANEKSPGLAMLKGTTIDGFLNKIIARKNAYKAEQEGAANLKGYIPFVGMGNAGEEALKRLRQQRDVRG